MCAGVKLRPPSPSTQLSLPLVRKKVLFETPFQEALLLNANVRLRSAGLYCCRTWCCFCPFSERTARWAENDTFLIFQTWGQTMALSNERWHLYIVKCCVISTVLFFSRRGHVNSQLYEKFELEIINKMLHLVWGSDIPYSCTAGQRAQGQLQ